MRRGAPQQALVAQEAQALVQRERAAVGHLRLQHHLVRAARHDLLNRPPHQLRACTAAARLSALQGSQACAACARRPAAPAQAHPVVRLNPLLRISGDHTYTCQRSMNKAALGLFLLRELGSSRRGKAHQRPVRGMHAPPRASQCSRAAGRRACPFCKPPCRSSARHQTP